MKYAQHPGANEKCVWTKLVGLMMIIRAFCKITFPGTPHFRWPFLDSPPKKFLHPKFSDDLLSHLPQKSLSNQAILKRNFHPKFFDDFFSHYLPNKNFSPPNNFKNVLVSGIFTHSYCISRNGPGRSRYAIIYYYDIAMLTYKIYIPHFHFPVRRIRARRPTVTKKPW